MDDSIDSIDNCCIHFNKTSSKPDTIQSLSEQNIIKILECSKRWSVTYKQPERTVAETVGAVSLTTANVCHKRCYSRLTNLNKLTKVEETHIKTQSTCSSSLLEVRIIILLLLVIN